MITFADLFAGGGGTSTGAFMVPGVYVSWALNHDPLAIKTHAANHPETKHYQADIRTQSVKELDPVDILWASLECTQHSKAKGGKDKDAGSFTLGWQLPRYVKHCDPTYIYIENVPEFVRWGELSNGKRVKDKEGLEYLEWVKAIKDLGYANYERRFLNAADFGCPTRRIRYFGIFSKAGYQITWPKPTHAEKENVFGLPKWIPCRDYIDLSNEGQSIFGRECNENIIKSKRHPLSQNTLRRIAGGVKKFAPELYFIMKYYGNSTEGNNFNCQSINSPLHTIPTKDRHVLVKCEKTQFIQDHCHTSSYNLPEEPLKVQLTRQTKQLITIEKHLIMDGNYNRDNVCSTLEKPMNTILASAKRLITAKAQFLSSQYNSNGKPEANNQSIDNPLGSLTTKEKFQFITAYFNSSGKPGSQNQSLEKPLGTILTGENKKALVTASLDGLIDFDIKMRFLTEDELASIMGFPEGYFKRPGLKLNKKQIIKMVGNAVHTGMAKALIYVAVKNLERLENKQTA
jgi:DNA (cytosine-5)-methyltransferase 1